MSNAPITHLTDFLETSGDITVIFLDMLNIYLVFSEKLTLENKLKHGITLITEEQET